MRQLREPPGTRRNTAEKAEIYPKSDLVTHHRPRPYQAVCGARDDAKWWCEVSRCDKKTERWIFGSVYASYDCCASRGNHPEHEGTWQNTTEISPKSDLVSAGVPPSPKKVVWGGMAQTRRDCSFGSYECIAKRIPQWGKSYGPLKILSSDGFGPNQAWQTGKRVHQERKCCKPAQTANAFICRLTVPVRSEKFPNRSLGTI